MQASLATTTLSFFDPMATINTIFGELMVTYTLSFPAENDEFINLNDARDVAFEIANETGEVINIYENFGASSNLIEAVRA
jgi:hypothetical protein